MTASRAGAYARLTRALNGAGPGAFARGTLERVRSIADDLVLTPDGDGIAARRSLAELAELLSELVFDARVPDELFVELDEAMLALGPSRAAGSGRHAGRSCGHPRSPGR